MFLLVLNNQLRNDATCCNEHLESFQSEVHSDSYVSHCLGKVKRKRNTDSFFFCCITSLTASPRYTNKKKIKL